MLPTHSAEVFDPYLWLFVHPYYDELPPRLDWRHLRLSSVNHFETKQKLWWDRLTASKPFYSERVDSIQTSIKYNFPGNYVIGLSTKVEVSIESPQKATNFMTQSSMLRVVIVWGYRLFGRDNTLHMNEKTNPTFSMNHVSNRCMKFPIILTLFRFLEKQASPSTNECKPTDWS